MSSRPAHPLATCASWELEEDLRHIGRMAAAHRTASTTISAESEETASETAETAATLRIDAPAARGDVVENLTDDAPELPAWSAVAATWLGLTALSCGGLLAGWSLWAGRPELMPIALPGAIAGCVGLALGQLAFRH